MATLEEKISKAKESAMKKAEKDGLNEDAANKLVAEAVAKVQKAWDEDKQNFEEDKS